MLYNHVEQFFRGTERIRPHRPNHIEKLLSIEDKDRLATIAKYVNNFNYVYGTKGAVDYFTYENNLNYSITDLIDACDVFGYDLTIDCDYITSFEKHQSRYEITINNGGEEIFYSAFGVDDGYSVDGTDRIYYVNPPFCLEE